MKRKRTLTGGLLVLLLLALAIGPGRAQGPEPSEELSPQAVVGTAFTYQGRLTDGGSPANGEYDFAFVLYDAASGGTEVGFYVVNDKAVVDGLFTVQLEYTNDPLRDQARWLEVWVRPGDSEDAYTPLAPLQPLTPAPYALALPGLWTEQNATSPNVIGGYNRNSVTDGAVGATIGGGGQSGLTNRVVGDFGTVGGGLGNLAGDDDFDPSDRFAPTVGGGHSNAATREYATVGGGMGNAAVGDSATVGGGFNNIAGGYRATVGGGSRNEADKSYATVGGGSNNIVSGTTGTIGGGYDNTVGGRYATVGGGSYNETSGVHATVGGGERNAASNSYATVGGGDSNEASDEYATVGGGTTNTASGASATVGGGGNNAAFVDGTTVGGGGSNRASGPFATVGGGWNGDASGSYATISGGDSNEASGDYSFAAGRRAHANHDGSFVLADSTDADFTSVREDALRTRFNGGAAFIVNNGEWVSIWDVGDMLINTSTNAHLTIGGVWTNGSDRAAKENFAPVDGEEVLARLADVPIQTWNYEAEGRSVRRMGPTAQDFHAAFGLGGSDTSIGTVDADGVALVSIQALYQRSLALEAENAALRGRLDELEARLGRLEAGPAGPVETPLLPGAVLLVGVGLVWVAQRTSGLPAPRGGGR